MKHTFRRRNTFDSKELGIKSDVANDLEKKIRIISELYIKCRLRKFRTFHVLVRDVHTSLAVSRKRFKMPNKN